MKLVSLTICRNSDWSIEAVLRSALKWVDECVVLDHASHDSTSAILSSLVRETKRIRVVRVDDPVWHEASHRQRTLEVARDMDATHCAIIDDDEILSENLVPRIRGALERMAPGETMNIPWVYLWRSLDRFRDDTSKWSRSYLPIGFRDSEALHWRTRGGYDHHHRGPFGCAPRNHGPFGVNSQNSGYLHGGGMLHYQHANWDRLMAKQTWYQMMELVRWPEFGIDRIKARYAPTFDETEIHTSPVPPEWWGPEKSLIRVGKPPWQKADMERMITEMGRDYFEGIL